MAGNKTVEIIQKQLEALGVEDTIEIRMERMEKQMYKFFDRLQNGSSAAAQGRDLYAEMKAIKDANDYRKELTEQLKEVKENERLAVIQRQLIRDKLKQEIRMEMMEVLSSDDKEKFLKTMNMSNNGKNIFDEKDDSNIFDSLNNGKNIFDEKDDSN